MIRPSRRICDKQGKIVKNFVKPSLSQILRKGLIIPNETMLKLFICVLYRLIKYCE